MAPRRCVSSKTSPASTAQEPAAPVEVVAKPAPSNVSEPEATFTLFPRLPPELRIRIWSHTLRDDFVMLVWNPTKRVFTSSRQPPFLLSVNQEARYFGLEHFKLSFASSPEFARVYFDFEVDILGVDWKSLGPAPGRLGRKISEDEMGKVAYLSLGEMPLLYHAKENMRELSNFHQLEEIVLVCEEQLPQKSGSMFGYDTMTQFLKENDGEGVEWWPRIWCLNSPDDNSACSACSSRHWWFAEWNKRTCWGQKMCWEEAMSKCLLMTLVDL